MSPCTVLVAREVADHVAGELLGRAVVRDQVLEAGVDALERGRLRIGDVAGDVFQREGLRAHARHGGGECAENTHNSSSTDARADAIAPRGRNIGGASQAPCQANYATLFQWVRRSGAWPGPCRARNAAGSAAGFAGPARRGLTPAREPRGRELQRHAVHAVAQAGRLRAVVEHMAEMAAAAAAMHLGARHEERAVGRGRRPHSAAADRSSASRCRCRISCPTRTAAGRSRRRRRCPCASRR